MGRYLVDGMNVVGSRPDGWWRNRREAAAQLISRLESWASASGAEVTVVFDGRGGGDHRAGPVEAVFTRYADDEIARRVVADPDPASLTVVTSDRPLAGRVRASGASTLGAGAFLRILQQAK